MDTFLDRGVTAVARGGLGKLPAEPEALDFEAPLYLDSKEGYRIETGYEGRLTAKVYDGRWKGSIADSDRLETAVAASFSLSGGSIKGSVAAGYGYNGYEIRAVNSKEDTYVHAKENFEAVKGGVYLNAFGKVSLGASIIDTEYRKAPEIPLQLEVSAPQWLKVGYQHSYSNFATDLDLRLLGHEGNLPLKSLESIDSLYLKLDYRGIRGKLSQELGVAKNRMVEAKVDLPKSWYLVGAYHRRDYEDINQGFTVDGTPSGYVKGALRKEAIRAGVGKKLQGGWNLEANFRHGSTAFDGGGGASSLAVAGFWPSLIVGNYNYLTSASISANQYHIGGEFTGERYSFGVGMQYIDLKPAAQVDYWRSSIFGLGSSGADSKKLTVQRIDMIFLGAGIGYRWKHIEAKYAMGQFIPVSVRDNKEEPPPSPATPGGGGGSSIFPEIADKIRHYPGGGLHRLLVSVTF
ncbi:hypothetical protein [Geoanaerobacter pelophilus]|nr:hypothetical protein [Geoanaerobacter pelophilus]